MDNGRKWTKVNENGRLWTMDRAKFIFMACLLLVTGCGYQAGQGETIACYETISLACIEGDATGSFPKHLIHAISLSSPLSYTRSGGELRLEVYLTDRDSHPIGYRYDPLTEDGPRKNLIPSENRLSLTALVTLTERGSGNLILEDEPVTASIEFDHDFYSSQKATNLFSLGQLADITQAEAAALDALYNKLAKEIVDRVNTSW